MFGARKMMMGGGKRPPKLLGHTGANTGSDLSSTITFAARTGDVGRLEVLILSAGGGGTFTPPAGWIEALDANTNPMFGIFYRDILADDTGNQVFTLSSSRRYISYFSLLFANARFDVAGAAATSATATVVAPGITASKKGLLFAAVSASSSSKTYSPPAGMTATESVVATGLSMALFQQEIAAGATGTRSMTTSAAVGQVGALFSIRGK